MDFAIISKFILNGVIAGSIYALLALGFSLIYGILRFVNLAHGDIALLGAFSFYVFYVGLGWPLIPSFIMGMTVFFVILLTLEKLTFLPVRDAPELIPLIVSLAVGILLRNVLALIFQPSARTMGVAAESFPLFSDIVRITNVQIVIIITTLSLMAGLWAFLKYTRIGMAIRAVSDNKEVAAILGIPINRVITYTFLVSGFITAVAGILAAFDQNLHPYLGTFFTIRALIAVILGGIGSIPGAVLGGYVLGLAENLLIAIPIGGWYIPSNYKDALAFLALLIMLYIRPSGIFGAKQEEGVRK